MKESAIFPVETMRHSAAHLLAAAISKLYPTAKFGIGPVVENGFYYDIELPEAVTQGDFEKIEQTMKSIREENHPFIREEVPLDEARELMQGLKQDYKLELLSDIEQYGTTKIGEQEEVGTLESDGKKMVSLYRTGDFVDLCQGPHVDTTKNIGAFKLMSVAGAYWRGDEKNKMLTRIYGIAFNTQEELDTHLHMLEEAEKRDHRKLGAELDLFAFSPLVGSGLPLFTPRGALLRRLLEEFVSSLQVKYGFQRVWIPHITKSDLYKTSGHWDKFEDDLFHVSSKKTEDQFVLKPMNCPHHTQIYASKPRSYRDLPLRYAEVTTVYRDENTGQLQGLSRVRSITQDDAHIFCTMDQAKDEIKNVYNVIKDFYSVFGMPLRVRLSSRDPKCPEKYLGGDEVWNNAENTLREILAEEGLQYEVGLGEAAFYGPKLDFIAKDAIGREWQLATIQLDFNQPERFDLTYKDNDGTDKRPVMVHRAILGSIERFLGILIEHYAGAFPLWLAPVQVALLPVGEGHLDVTYEFAKQLEAEGIRAEVDDSGETVGKKIRNAEKAKVPYMIVIGDKEADLKEFAVRIKGQKDNIQLTKKELFGRLSDEVAERK